MRISVCLCVKCCIKNQMYLCVFECICINSCYVWLFVHACSAVSLHLQTAEPQNLLNSVNKTSRGIQTGGHSKVRWIVLKILNKKNPKKLKINSLFFYFMKPQQKKEKKWVWSFQSMNNSVACSLSPCRCSQWLTDGLEGQCNWVLEAFSPGEQRHVCLCDICDTERVACCRSTDIWGEKNNIMSNTVIRTREDKRWVRGDTHSTIIWRGAFINIKEGIICSLWSLTLTFYVCIIMLWINYIALMLFTEINAQSCRNKWFYSFMEKKLSTELMTLGDLKLEPKWPVTTLLSLRLQIRIRKFQILFLTSGFEPIQAFSWWWLLHQTQHRMNKTSMSQYEKTKHKSTYVNLHRDNSNAKRDILESDSAALTSCWKSRWLLQHVFVLPKRKRSFPFLIPQPETIQKSNFCSWQQYSGLPLAAAF